MLKSEYIHIYIIVTSKNICNIFDCIHISDTLSASGLWVSSLWCFCSSLTCWFRCCIQPGYNLTACAQIRVALWYKAFVPDSLSCVMRNSLAFCSGQATNISYLVIFAISAIVCGYRSTWQQILIDMRFVWASAGQAFCVSNWQGAYILPAQVLH